MKDCLWGNPIILFDIVLNEFSNYLPIRQLDHRPYAPAKIKLCTWAGCSPHFFCISFIYGGRRCRSRSTQTCGSDYCTWKC